MNHNGKTLLALLLTFSFSIFQVSAQCPSGDVYLTNQAEVDLFGTTYPTCTEIEGSLYIGSFTGSSSDISDLSALENLEVIAAGLAVLNSDLLTDLEGLDNLDKISGEINFTDNDNLTGFTDLASVIGAVPSIKIINNNSITNLIGLGNISIAGSLNIQSNQSLTSLTGLGAIGTLTGLKLVNNDLLTNISALGGVQQANIVKIQDNQSLPSLLGLGDLSTITQDLIIVNNRLLGDLGALSNLNLIGNQLIIDEMPAITSLSGLENLGSLVQLVIKNNDYLTDISAIDNITHVSEVTVQDNPVLSSLQGLHTIQNLSSLNIINNNSLVNLQGLNGLTTVSDFFEIYNNANLLSLEGVNNVGTLTGIVSIIANKKLTSLAAIDQTVLSGTKLNIYENHELSVCNVNSVCQYLTDYPGKSVFFNNDTNCQTVNTVQIACGLALPVELIRFDATQVEDKAKLVWATASEVNNLGFEVEKSTDGINWTAIGFEKGEGRAANYVHFDNKPKSGANYYRLQQVDIDGFRTISPVKQVNFVTNISDMAVYPNPARDLVTIELPTDRFQATNVIKLYSLTGTMVRSWQVENSKTQSLNLSDVPSGHYVLSLDGMRQMLIISANN